MPSRRRRGSEYPFAASQAGLQQQIGLFYGKQFDWIPNHRFHPTRKWELDVACPSLMLACEYQGGLYMTRKGGHQTAKGMRRDWEKLNEAQIFGWMVLVFGPDETRTGNATHVIERAIKARVQR